MNNYFSLAGLCIGVINLCLALLITFFGKNKLHKVWSYVNYSISFWGFSMYVSGSTMNQDISFLGWKMFTVGIALIALFYYHVIYIFCDLKSRKFLLFSYIESAVFIALTVFSNFMFGDKVIFSFNQLYYFRANLLYNFFMFVWSIVVGKSFFELYKYIKKSKGITNIQAKYLFVAMVFGFGGGMNTAPAAWGFNIYPYGQILVCVYGMVATYAMFRYRIMDIRLAISNTVIFIAVYSLVLGVPFWIGFKLLGYGTWLLPVIFMGLLASVGPSIYIFLKRQAKDKILLELKRYRTALDNASIVVNRFKSVDEIVQHVSKVFFTEIGIKNVAVYLRKGELLILRTTGTNEAMFQKEINNKQLMEYFVQKNHSVIIKEMHDNGHKNKQNINGVIKESQTEVAMPLVKSDSLVGLILLGEKNNDSPYSDDELKAFSSNSSHFALAIENVQYLDEQKKLNEEENKNRRQFQLDKLVSSMGHQIRNPLNVISGAMTGIEIVMKKYKSVIEQRYYNRLEEKKNEIMVACGGISTTINTILDYGRGTIELRRIKVNDILKEFNILTQMIIGKYMISPNVEIEKDVPDVFGDIHTINEILSTYFDNSCQAVEANEGAKKIDFKIYKMDGEYVRFEIADNGHGIDEDTQRAIFDVSTSTKGTKGHGFGLVSVRKACSQMKGTKYGFYSAGRGFGSKFWIDVPIATN
jgi:signal transduction histidine kinase